MHAEDHQCQEVDPVERRQGETVGDRTVNIGIALGPDRERHRHEGDREQDEESAAQDRVAPWFYRRGKLQTILPAPSALPSRRKRCQTGRQRAAGDLDLVLVVFERRGIEERARRRFVGEVGGEFVALEISFDRMLAIRADCDPAEDDARIGDLAAVAPAGSRATEAIAKSQTPRGRIFWNVPTDPPAPAESPLRSGFRRNAGCGTARGRRSARRPGSALRAASSRVPDGEAIIDRWHPAPQARSPRRRDRPQSTSRPPITL